MVLGLNAASLLRRFSSYSANDGHDHSHCGDVLLWPGDKGGGIRRVLRIFLWLCKRRSGARAVRRMANAGW